MGSRKMEEIVVVVVMMAILARRVSSEVGAKSSSSCQNKTARLSPCYFYIDGTECWPSLICCNRFRKMVNDEPQCLCQVANDKGLNQTRVSDLPAACNVQTPPISNCYAPPPSSGYSTKISNSLLLSLLTVASYAGILIFI